MKQKIIVISAVNLVEGGTLTILRDCLQYLSQLAEHGEFKIFAIVNNKDLAYYPNIDYLVRPWPKKNWFNRLWFEYVSMKKISVEIGDVYLWFSLHDTSPNVKSVKQAVYCHNPFPFYKWNVRELFLTPKIVLFSLFSKFAYQINIRRNNFVIVQQQWIKERFKSMFGLSGHSIIVAKPDNPEVQYLPTRNADYNKYRFIYAASPNSHKNFECLAEATKILSESIKGKFEVIITVKGDENAYARWLKGKWGDVEQLVFSGFMTRDCLFQHYANADALVFPSKAETWGLPMSEFAQFGKPMLLADLPYAYETAGGSEFTSFFNPSNPAELAHQMKLLIEGRANFLIQTPTIPVEEPSVANWKDLFTILLK